MKRYIRSDESKSFRHHDAMKKLLTKLQSEGVSCALNKDHSCIDIFDSSGFLIQQLYPKEMEGVPKERFYFEKVDDGKGDYKRLSRVVTERRYSDIDPRIHFIAYTNDPSDDRYVAKN